MTQQQAQQLLSTYGINGLLAMGVTTDQINAILVAAGKEPLSTPAPVPAPTPTPSNTIRTISVWDRQTKIADTDAISAAVTAIQDQVTNDLLQVHNLTANLVYIPGSSTPDPSSWVVALVDDASSAQYLGIHQFLNNKPITHVYMSLAMQFIWTVVLSHEVLETIANPDLALYGLNNNDLVPFELCDAVNLDAYQVDGVSVCNFVYPSWFVSGAAGPYDRLGHLEYPFDIRLGYANVLQVGGVGSWVQKFPPGNASFRPMIGNRSNLITIPKDVWKESRVG